MKSNEKLGRNIYNSYCRQQNNHANMERDAIN